MFKIGVKITTFAANLKKITMTLIKSISGFRGTIGGAIGDNLTPSDLVKFTASFVKFLRKGKNEKIKVVVGRDARLSGKMVEDVVIGTLMGCGADVIQLGLATTPTTELAVTHYKADGGIIITASHNPKQWNALKLLGPLGEFLNAEEGGEVLRTAAAEDYEFVEVDDLGKVIVSESFDQKHIEAALNLPLVKREEIKARKLKVVVDAVNSVGGIVIPELLERLGVEVVKSNCTPDGNFAHNPEPLKENLTEIAAKVVEEKADMGIVVDPDVDRLAFFREDGEMFGEEYTLVAVADYILGKKTGNTVSNLSSSRALRDVTTAHGGSYSAAAVGEVNVVKKMKDTGAIIGGEGNGGVIYPELHYGRDALVGVVLFLSYYVEKGLSMSELRKTLPEYHIYKSKIQLSPEMDVDKILASIKEKYSNEKITDIDGVKIDFEEGWVHLRKSNTEPIIRIYAEAHSIEKAKALADSLREF